jgi:hypothetical protein
MEEQIKKYTKLNGCHHPEHNPATMKYREPGLYRHTCPACGVKTEFEVPLVTC